MEITYEIIKPLIKRADLVNGNQIQLEFCATNQDTPISTVAVIVPEKNEIVKNATKQVVKRTIINTLLNQFSRLFGSVGGSLVSSVGRSVVNQNQNTSAFTQTEITQEKREKAIVDAFKSLKAMYKFNEQSSLWEYGVQ